MCGKYYADREFIPRLSNIFRDQGITIDPELQEEWNKVLLDDEYDAMDISPTDYAVTITAADDDLLASKMKWGFTDRSHNSLVINARSESAAEKPMFAESIRDRRCVIPASGYYEWDRAKSRFRFRDASDELILLAGIYRVEQEEPRFTILTTEANECMKPVHPRMPVAIRQDEIRKWITDRDSARELISRRQEELVRMQDSGQIAMDLGV